MTATLDKKVARGKNDNHHNYQQSAIFNSQSQQ